MNTCFNLKIDAWGVLGVISNNISGGRSKSTKVFLTSLVPNKVLEKTAQSQAKAQIIEPPSSYHNHFIQPKIYKLVNTESTIHSLTPFVTILILNLELT